MDDINAKFDWFAATIDHDPLSLISHLRHRFDLSQVSPGKPRFSYTEAVRIHRGNRTLCEVLWGGENGSASAHAIATGSESTLLRSLMLELSTASGYPIRPSRIDSCIDWIEEGLFDDISKAAIKWALKNNLKLSYKGDWARGKARTLYIGSRQSDVFIRIYEKGYECGGNIHWVRYEVEFKPHKKRKAAAIGMTPNEILFCGISGKLLNHLGIGSQLPTPLDGIYIPSDVERSRKALIKQYRNILNEWANECGSFEELGVQIQMRINQQEEDLLCS